MEMSVNNWLLAPWAKNWLLAEIDGYVYNHTHRYYNIKFKENLKTGIILLPTHVIR